jgi:hypothetical protein
MTDDIKPLGIQHAKITGQVMRDHWGPIVDRIAADSLSQHCPNCEAQAAEIEKLREALRDIQIEAERERGNWTHLKQVIARKARAALGEAK